MYRHIALFRFVPEMTPEQRLAALEGLRSLPAQIPELLDYRVGPDAGGAEGNFDFAVVADFAEAAHYPVYAGHPAHVAVADTHVRPFIAERAAIQYDI
jgi:hypothetical protein